MASRAALIRRIEALEARRAERLAPNKPRRLNYRERLVYEAAHPELFEEARQQQAERDAQKKRECAEFEAADTPGKVAILRTKLAAVHDEWKNREPWRGPGREPYWSRIANDPQHYRVKVHSLELDIAELEGLLSAEQVWVARSRLSSATRANTAVGPVPTHDECLKEIAAGHVDDYCRPERLKKPSEPRVPVLVSPLEGPQAPKRLPGPRAEPRPRDESEPPHRSPSPREEFERQNPAVDSFQVVSPPRSNDGYRDLVSSWGCTEPPPGST
jgi:hypothetical protein